MGESVVTVFSLQQFEFLLAILIRVSGFVYSAPFFSLRNVPATVKIGFSAVVAIATAYALPYEPLQYNGIVGFSVIIVSELLVGLILGFLANVCYQILALSGQLLDMEVGFSMVNELDPVTSSQVTVSGNFYSYAVMLMMMVTYMHHYLLQALIDTYAIIPIGGASVNPGIYVVAVDLIKDYFIIAFRIMLPIFGSILLVNTILAIMAKVAPQMSLFVVGIQLKALVGLTVLLIIIELLPGVADLLFGKMMEVLRNAVAYL